MAQGHQGVASADLNPAPMLDGAALQRTGMAAQAAVSPRAATRGQAQEASPAGGHHLPATAPANGRAGPNFAHPSEAEFARILDFYQIKWEYEPRTFPLRWAEDGRVIEQFTPDFYLPELDLYIELTTLRQRLVTKKNRKLRRLRALHPEVRIKLLYNRDYRNLLFKYGLQTEPDQKEQ